MALSAAGKSTSICGIAHTHPGVKNFHVAVREWNDRVIFLRKIVPGGADKSDGLQVARLAGLPPQILTRAREILDRLEGGEPPTPVVVQKAVVRATRGKAERRDRVEEPELGLF